MTRALRVSSSTENLTFSIKMTRIRSEISHQPPFVTVEDFLVKHYDLFMAALSNRAGHSLYFYPVVSIFLSIFLPFSSPNLSCHRLDVYHTSTHGVALCEFRMQV